MSYHCQLFSSINLTGAAEESVAGILGLQIAAVCAWLDIWAQKSVDRSRF